MVTRIISHWRATDPAVDMHQHIKPLTAFAASASSFRRDDRSLGTRNRIHPLPPRFEKADFWN